MLDEKGCWIGTNPDDARRQVMILDENGHFLGVYEDFAVEEEEPAEEPETPSEVKSKRGGKIAV